MPEAMKAKMKSITLELSRQIQDINGDPKNTDKMRVEKIAALKGAPKEELFDFLEKNFRTGPGLHPEIERFISKNRSKNLSKKDK